MTRNPKTNKSRFGEGHINFILRCNSLHASGTRFAILAYRPIFLDDCAGRQELVSVDHVGVTGVPHRAECMVRLEVST